MNEFTGRRLLNAIARSLGYDDVMLAARHCDGSDSDSCEYVIEYSDLYIYFRKFGGDDAVLKDSEQKTIAADMTVTSDNDASIAAAYEFFAESAYRLLNCGKSIFADFREVKADDVPEFMIQCVLIGVAE